MTLGDIDTSQRILVVDDASSWKTGHGIRVERSGLTQAIANDFWESTPEETLVQNSTGQEEAHILFSGDTADEASEQMGFDWNLVDFGRIIRISISQNARDGVYL